MKTDGFLHILAAVALLAVSAGLSWQTHVLREVEVERDSLLEVTKEQGNGLDKCRAVNAQCGQALQLGAKLIESYEERLKMCWVASN